MDDQGQVTGLSAGSAVITAASKEGNFTAECTVTVEGAKNWYVNGVDGSDENDGLTDDKALKSVKNAVEKAEDGDIIVICGPVSLGEEEIVTDIDKGLTFTGKTAEKDYNNTAQLTLAGNISLCGETVFQNIQLKIGRTMDIYANGNTLLFDYGDVYKRQHFPQPVQRSVIL